jgi:outer membrane protein assembly factor BamD (BamD/ComL family)
LVKVHTLDQPEKRKEYKIAGLPTVIVARSGGTEIDRTLGYLKTTNFISTVDDYQKGIGTLGAMMAQEKEKAEDPAFLYLLGKKLFAHSRWDDADQRYAVVVSLDPENKSGSADKAQLGRANAEGKKENYAKAVTNCRELLKRWPQSDLAPDALSYMGWYATTGGMTDDAVAAYNEYLKRWPKGEDAEFVKEELTKLKNPTKND